MTFLRAFLIVFSLLATEISHLALASRGLYFSASKMTSSQKNTISSYTQGTVVDVQMSKLSQSNTVDVAAINGKSFDFTTTDTAGAGYLSYDILKSALNNKYLVGEVTFKVATSQQTNAQTQVTQYEILKDTDVTFFGTNAKLVGTTGSSSLVTTGATQYIVENDGVEKTDILNIPGGNDLKDIVIPSYQTGRYCVVNAAKTEEVCAPLSYINAVYGTTKDIPLSNLFNNAKSATMKGNQTADGPYATAQLFSKETIQVDGKPRTLYTLPENGTVYQQIYSPTFSTIPYDAPANSISTEVTNAKVTMKVAAGTVIEVLNNGNTSGGGGTLSAITQSSTTSSTIAPQTITIDGNIATATNYACTTEAKGRTQCDVQSAPVTTAGTPNYEAVDPNSSTYIKRTLFSNNGDKYYPVYPGTNPSVNYYPEGGIQAAQTSLDSGNILNNSTTTGTITTSGKSTFTDAAFDFTSNSTYTNMQFTHGTSDFRASTINRVESGIELYAPLLDQPNYLNTAFLAIAQNIRLDPTKFGSGGTLTDLKQVFSDNASSSPLAYNSANVISYIDGDTTYQGADALSKISKAYAAAKSTDGNIQSYAAVGDVSYTSNAFANRIQENLANCNDTNCGVVGYDKAWKDNSAVNGIIDLIQDFPALQNVLNKTADAFNSALADSKANNLASYQANYQKDSSGKYIVDASGEKIKDGTYDVTLKAKDWAFEIENIKQMVRENMSTSDLTPQYNEASLMQQFVSAFSGQSAGGAELSIGYKFRLFKSAFYAAPQFDISMFRNTTSTITANKQAITTGSGKPADKTVIYGNIDSSYAGSLVAKIGFENKLNFIMFKVPLSIYGFGGGTSGVIKYRNANSHSFGLKYGFGGEIFLSKNMSVFAEMFWINLMKQNINYVNTSGYDVKTNNNDVKSFVNGSLGTTVTLDNAQYGEDNKNLSIKYAELSQVIDKNSIKYTTNETFSNQGIIQGMKFGLTYYVE